MLAIARYSLLEKLNCFLFYREWERGHNLLLAAKKLHDEGEQFAADRSVSKKYAQVLAHFKSDLVAQIYRDCGSGI